jgi:hypothetical protein
VTQHEIRFKEYTTINESIVRPIAPYALFLICISATVFFCTALNWMVLAFMLFVSWFILTLLHAFRKRYCPICGTVMEKDQSQGLFPENHYCKEHKILICTNVKNMSTG